MVISLLNIDIRNENNSNVLPKYHFRHEIERIRFFEEEILKCVQAFYTLTGLTTVGVTNSGINA